MSADAVSARSVRIYDRIRSAHLERLPDMAPADFWYVQRRGDFDAALVDPLDPPRQLSRRTMLMRLLRTRRSVIEVPEPAMPRNWPLLIGVVTLVRLQNLLPGGHGEVVAYCIDNSDPAIEVGRRLRLPPFAARLLTAAAMRLIVRGTTRLAFGTEGARAMYRRYIGDRRLRQQSRVFDALPAPCACGRTDDDSPPAGVLFLGSFVERKGIRQLLAAWDQVRTQPPTPKLTLIGNGPFSELVQQWASDRPEVDVVLDPPREDIHRALRNAAVVVLLSQPVGGWREQIGLPILEGLAHGCEIVTTSETGIADWLGSHGHEVDPPTAEPRVVAMSIRRALARSAARDGSLADLPSQDQRIVADQWLHQPG